MFNAIIVAFAVGLVMYIVMTTLRETAVARNWSVPTPPVWRSSILAGVITLVLMITLV